MLSEIRQNFLLEAPQATRLMGFFFALNALLVFVPARSLSFFTLIWASNTAIFALTPHIVRLWRLGEMRRQLPFIVSSLILGIGTGLSLRPALQRTAAHFGGYVGQKLRKLHDHLVLKAPLTQIDPLLRDLQAALMSCEAEPHLTAQRLLGYRYKLVVEDKFRRKTAQALHQLRGQCYVLIVMYVITFSFVCSYFGFKEHARLMVISLVIFAGGIFLTLAQGRKITWTV